MDEDDWELVNDDGFVYKRRKRPRLDPSAAAATSSSSALAIPDPATQEKNRRERKKAALLKIREKYQQELLQWELLSNTLCAMQNSSQNPNPGQQHKVVPVPESSASDQLVDELIFQAEQQEAILEDLSNLCDVAENLCNAREEEFNKAFTELPVWSSSPRELMASLCVD